MTALLAELVGDLAEESAVLDALLAPLDEDDWARPTPAETWTVSDQVTHLAYFDDAAALGMTDADTFVAQAEVLVRQHAPDFPGWVATQYRSLPGGECRAWFRGARAHLLAVSEHLDPETEVPWYGRVMSPASLLTARLMETWAHGQDVAAALGVDYPPSARLRHIAHLGVRTLPFSFTVRGEAVPEAPVRVELRAPDGSTWSWGDATAADRVRGPAVDFCSVVTQRRHVDDTALEVSGSTARRWMLVAQAFAGRPTSVAPRST